MRLSVEAGHDVTVMVRPGADFHPVPGVRVIRASALQPDQIAGASRGRDVVLSCIGPQRVQPFNPWSALRPPAHVAELSARALVEGLRESGVRRVVAISAAGVGDSRPRISTLMRWLIEHSTIGPMYDDLHSMEETFRRSHLDWMAVRPVTLMNGGPTNKTREVDRYYATSSISRADVAARMLQEATKPGPLAGATPMIAGT